MKRILHKLKLTEISGVDRPCQEGALVTIMKRDQRLDKLQERINKLRAKVHALEKAESKL